MENVENLSLMFYKCINLKRVDFSNTNLSKIKDDGSTPKLRDSLKFDLLEVFDKKQKKLYEKIDYNENRKIGALN